MKQKIIKKSDIEKIKEKIQTEINESFSSAKKAPFPKKETLNNYIYADS